MPLLGKVLVQRGDARSVADGREWLQQAAEAGDATAALQLGKRWLKGAPGLPADADRALPWLERAADQRQGKPIRTKPVPGSNARPSKTIRRPICNCCWRRPMPRWDCNARPLPRKSAGAKPSTP
ncbi:MAG: hypothetical protein EKK45_29125 [Curvibacter sp.]|nr:MAG: hypothetical protein EKK45_29125 [Curvibacter sp.]